MKWNESQQRAIDQRGTNMLVSAAAGSGKTAVLVERIKKLIIEEGISIDRMLVVTFTNAAAAEMKEKVRKALNEEIEADPANSQKLRGQLALLSRANISTFHAFALEVIRNFFFLIDMEPGFSICDDAQSTIIKEDAMDLLMEENFAENSPEFHQFLDWYSSDRNQDKIREIIAKTYNVLQSFPYPWQWLDDHIEALSLTKEEFENSDIMRRIWGFVRETLTEATLLIETAVSLLSEIGLDRLASKVEQEELVQYKAILTTCEAGDFDQLAGLLSNFGTLRLVAGKEEKEDYEQIKETVSAYRIKAKKAREGIEKLLFIDTLEIQIQEMNQTAPLAKTLKKLLMDFDQLFRSGKEAKKLIDFNDIEHYCLQILESEQASDHFRQRFEYIFIDEYQDTNVLQEEIIAKVKGEDNLFMVGDIKQSIYRFRLAEPAIFKEKYDTYGNLATENAIKIDLNRNYRSKPAVLAEINYIFQHLMEDYDEDARLYPGIAYEGEYDFVPELKVVDISTMDDDDDELAGLKAAEIEALEACEIIKANLGRNYFNSKAGEERTLDYRDMVVLMRSARNSADVYYRVLKEQGIEAYIDDSEGYFDTMEINVLMNLLSVIDNKLQDVPLISVLHSEIFDFSTQELGRIRAEHKNSAYGEAFLWYGENGNIPILRTKCATALSSIKGWKGLASSMPLGKFIWKLMLETNHYLMMGAMPGGGQRQANLRALVDKAEKFAVDRQSSLYSFVGYIEAMKKRRVSMGQVKLVGEADNLVRIMTIHKSKGLEFPMVIVAGLGKRLNFDKLGKGVYLHKDVGIGMTLADFQGHWYKQTLLQKLIQLQIRKEEKAEEVRVLYVALTRARDILYMTATTKDGLKFLESREVSLGGDSTFLDMIQSISKLEMINCNKFQLSHSNTKMRSGMDQVAFCEHYSDTQQNEVLKRLDFVYPHEATRRLKSKYSVTELNHGQGHAVHASHILAVPKFRQGEKQLTAAEKGTIYHGIMERIDFDRAEKEGMAYLSEATEEMVVKEIFTEMEVKEVNLQRIEDFFHTELGRRCAEAARADGIQRERSFNLESQLEGETVIVQGIIDCYFEEADGIVLLDYKTTWIEEKQLTETYRKQIEMYSQVLQKAKGKKVKEAYLYLFGPGKMVKM